RQHGHTAPLSIHVSREDIQTPPPGGWVPRKPAYPLAQARDVNGAAVEVDRDAADDMTRYWHADTSDDGMPGTVVVTEGGGGPGIRAAHQSSPGLTGR